METRLSRWRYLAGAAYGLLLAAVLTVASTRLMDPLVWRCVHGTGAGDDQLAHDTWLELTPPDWHTVLVLGFLLLVPAGAILQRRPPFPRWVSPRAAAYIVPIAAFAYGYAVVYALEAALSWMWALQD